MLAKVYSGAVVGLDAVLVTVEVDMTKRGFGGFKIVGLGDKAIEEAKERVTSGIINSKADFPQYKITVNLAPADLPKEGPAYDLPIALGILLASGQIPSTPEMTEGLILGELSLDGTLRCTPGVLPLTILARKEKFRRVFLPAINAKEAAVVQNIEIMPVESIGQIFHHFSGLTEIKKHPPVNLAELLSNEEDYEFDLKDVVGQEQVKRALEIAAAGGHNLAMVGPPGAGKTLLARTLPSILPRLTREEALELTKIYSITGKLDPEKPLATHRPFRSPHHTTSRIGLIGGGSKIIPGEISLAHRGILFLDEFPELPRHVLESLRQPLEDGTVQISRATGSVIFPSQFMLVAASNPCPCGWYQSKEKACTCTAGLIRHYRKKVSGPILDRIDLHVEVPAVKVEELTEDAKERESSAQVRQRVQKARDRQMGRYQGLSLTCNAELAARDVKKYCRVDEEGKRILSLAMRKMSLSARSYHKVLKVARTIADLASAEEIESFHLSESLQFRPKEE